MRAVIRVVLLLAAMGFAGLVQAQAWPNKPVRLIVAFAPGAQPDIIARLLADRLTRALGQQVIVDNRPGTANLVGAQAVARAPADGYTYFFGTSAALITNPLLFKSLPYDPARDFTPVSFVVKSPFFVLAHPDLPVKNLADLFALAKTKPGTLNFATDGARNASGVLASWVSKAAGSPIQQVPYAVMPQGLQDTIAGRTQLVILSVAPSSQHVKRGALRALDEKVLELERRTEFRAKCGHAARRLRTFEVRHCDVFHGQLAVSVLAEQLSGIDMLHHKSFTR